MKTIAESPVLDLVQKPDGYYGVNVKLMSVAVLPYTIDSSGIVQQIGILNEWNELRPGGYANTLITGTIQDSDEDTLQTAIRELMEEGGIDTRGDGTDRWTYLGTFHDSKDTNREMPIFAVDVTGKKIEAPTPDGSIKEENSKFLMKNVNDALATKELLVLGAFLRLFMIMYHKSFTHAK
jgi:8-oxo-dGTP pyrophosphatase MutT (NUDIX family)